MIVIFSFVSLLQGYGTEMCFTGIGKFRNFLYKIKIAVVPNTSVMTKGSIYITYHRVLEYVSDTCFTSLFL